MARQRHTQRYQWPGYEEWSKTHRELLRGLPYWRAHHEYYYCPEITDEHGQTWHYLDVEHFLRWLTEIATDRQAKVLIYWLEGAKEREIAEAMGLDGGQPVLMYLHDLLRKAYKALGKAA